MRASIVTHHASVSIARSVETSLRPDNEAAPAPLRVKSRAKGKRVTSIITGAQDIESLLTTIDDLLLCLIAADQVLSGVSWKRLRRST